MTDELESNLYIYLLTSERGFRTGFAGTGVKRRRSPTLTRCLAELIQAKLHINYRFSKADKPVERIAVIDVITKQLEGVPDDIAKASTSRNSDVSTPANKQIAHGIYCALNMEFSRTFESQNYLDPASPRYIHAYRKQE